MPQHHVMDHTGHTTIDFDAANAEMLADAQKRFEELIGNGYTAAKRTGPGELEQVRTFDPSIDETVFTPRLVGG